MFNPFAPAFKKSVLQTSPQVWMWQPKEKKDVIIEIQDKNWRFADDLVNHLANFSEDLILTAVTPKKPHMLFGNPFNAEQTSLAFGGSTEESKIIFVAEFYSWLQKGKALTARNLPKEAKKKK